MFGAHAAGSSWCSTKADLCDDLPTSVRSYLESDPFRDSSGTWNARRMTLYIEEMGRISNQIQEWIGQEASGRKLLRLAETNRLPLRVCAISSLGMPPRNLEPSPCRVLDPFFWGLELMSGRAHRREGA